MNFVEYHQAWQDLKPQLERFESNTGMSLTLVSTGAIMLRHNLKLLLETPERTCSENRKTLLEDLEHLVRQWFNFGTGGSQQWDWEPEFSLFLWLSKESISREGKHSTTIRRLMRLERLLQTLDRRAGQGHPEAERSPLERSCPDEAQPQPREDHEGSIAPELDLDWEEHEEELECSSELDDDLDDSLCLGCGQVIGPDHEGCIEIFRRVDNFYSGEYVDQIEAIQSTLRAAGEEAEVYMASLRERGQAELSLCALQKQIAQDLDCHTWDLAGMSEHRFMSEVLQGYSVYAGTTEYFGGMLSGSGETFFCTDETVLEEEIATAQKRADVVLAYCKGLRGAA